MNRSELKRLAKVGLGLEPEPVPAMTEQELDAFFQGVIDLVDDYDNLWGDSVGV